VDQPRRPQRPDRRDRTARAHTRHLATARPPQRARHRQTSVAGSLALGPNELGRG
jgi:hypothetical protein